ncbi:hypothetical protein ABID22_003794 [Pontibacter aydingkolensis]|uniref:Uncharacterized protein n=1 Tax=Pontibacter aydingkolensis TaxID=1911536 RepID=A0ABS7CZ44_9BACT|nr:hypothetical protein [Pontibacter aydingkolensis]MBW7469085.1 hypothetical protein [Pontibacter aydingkolensis]
MAGLQADQLNSEFLKNFIPETIYLVDGDIAAPAPALPQETEAAVVAPVAAAAPTATVKPTEALVANEEAPVPPAQHKPKPTPTLPKLPKDEAAKAPGKYKTIGENKKGVVILVTLPEEQFIKLPQLEFLNKILGAIGLQPTDVAYLNNVSGAIAKFEDMQQELQVNYIISFASRLDTDLPHDKFTLYNPVLVGSVPVLFSQSLAMLEHDVEHKKQLWGALQKIFNR